MLSRAYMCSVYLECIFRQPTQPTKDLREKKHIFSRIFRDISGRADPPIIGPSGQSYQKKKTTYNSISIKYGGACQV